MEKEGGLLIQGGCDIRPCDKGIDLTDTKRYTELKLTEDQKIQVEALASAMPSMMGTAVAAQSYALTFPEGVQGELMKLKRGGFSTVLQDPETGSIVGTAALEPAVAQAVCLGAFTAMSIASGQYFLAEINSKLNMMKLSLDKILEFLYGDKRAELMSEISFIRYAYQNYSSIMDHEQQRLSTIISLQNSRKVAMKDIEFYLADLSSTVTGKDQIDILATVEKAVQMKDCLDLSMQLYVLSDLLEVFYSQNYDKDYLRYMEDDAAAYINKCDKRILTSFSMLQQALASHKDGLFKKIDKDILEIQTKQIESVVEGLNLAETSPLRELLHSALQVPEKKAEFYLGAEGIVYMKAQ